MSRGLSSNRMCFSQLLCVRFQRHNTGDLMCGDPPQLQGVAVSNSGSQCLPGSQWLLSLTFRDLKISPAFSAAAIPPFPRKATFGHSGLSFHTEN